MPAKKQRAKHQRPRRRLKALQGTRYSAYAAHVAAYFHEGEHYKGYEATDIGGKRSGMLALRGAAAGRVRMIAAPRGVHSAG